MTKLRMAEPLTIIVQNAPDPSTGKPRNSLISYDARCLCACEDCDRRRSLGADRFRNISRRSLFTDIEHAVAILDEDDLFAKEYRKTLWAEHFRHPTPDDFDDLDAALHAWDATWGVAGAAPALPMRAADDPGPPYLDRISLPVSPDVPLQGWARTSRNRYLDIDSRMPWRPGTPWEPSVSLDEVPL